MSQLSYDSPLLVRDAQGRYLPASAEQILEAARQIIDQKVARGDVFSSPMLVKSYLRTKLAGYDHEVFAVLLLDTRHALIAYVEMFHGTIDQAAVYPREIVKLALKHNAAAAILSHCHPSCNNEPSRADEVMTRRLRDALALVDVRMLDHIIVAGATTVSFSERGLL
ncbi:RadC-like JAB domain protein [Bordetella bronchiseptica F4563]|uniref:JAB domain-containing protein n=1 Tax=Bordetella bronchiseptica TaxID=518 RepID=UPI0004613250|nr:JAB domain-containing protein [Bordetella bronchiseptica]KDC32860.1 RadC-like JAB domain protein [Bordetella bronchiseptica F4563]